MNYKLMRQLFKGLHSWIMFSSSRSYSKVKSSLSNMDSTCQPQAKDNVDNRPNGQELPTHRNDSVTYLSDFYIFLTTSEEL